MSRTVSVWLPKLLPGVHQNPNGNQKRVPKLVAEDKRVMREAVKYGLLADDGARELVGAFTYVHLFMELRWCKRWRDRETYLPDDPSNAAYALKAAVDGIVDAGLLLDDSWKYIWPLSTAVTRVDTREEEGLWIVISENPAVEPAP
jgi:hypothetical protein